MSKRKPKIYPFNGDEFFRNLLGSEIPEFLSLQQGVTEDNSKIVEVYAFIMCKCLCDSEGIRIFEDEEIELCRNEDFGDLKRLAEKVLDNMDLGEEVKN